MRFYGLFVNYLSWPLWSESEGGGIIPVLEG